MQADPGKRELIVSKVWLQAAIVVFLFGFFVLGLLAYRTYTSDPPIPERVVAPAGRVIFTADDIRDGQRVFLRNGLIEYGAAGADAGGGTARPHAGFVPVDPVNAPGSV